MSLTYLSPALSVTVTTPGSPDVVDCLFEGWHSGSPESDVTVAFGPIESLHAAPDSAPIGYGELRGWVTSSVLYLACDRGALQVDYLARHGTIHLPVARPDLAFARDTLWRIVALELARTVGRYYLHGAALVSPLGAEVICADGGIGKSTLAAAWLAAGHAAVTDDGAMLVPGDPGIVTALPGAWRLSPPADRWCSLPPAPDPAPADGASTDHGLTVKRRFWPPAAQIVSQAPIHRLHFAERGASTALVPLSPSQALTRLIRQNPLLMASQALAGNHLEALCMLSEHVPAYILQLSPGLLKNPRNALNLLGV
ncbi:MAG: hypothetical protein H7338_14905 [Candidatus Sericytochromatia bacterium]|nr:hypothetical protein [Candidatus Sericytochromatia bacterium]